MNLFTALGAFELYTGIYVLQNFPTWGWIVLLGVGLIVMPFRAFHKVRVQRDGLRVQLKEREQKNFAVMWVDEEWWLRIPNGQQKFWEDESAGLGLLLRGHISVTTIGTIQVESVTLDMGRQSYTSNWVSERFYTSEEREVDFEIPLDTQRGKRTAVLKAIVDGQPYTSKLFILDLPNGRRMFQKGSHGY